MSPGTIYILSFIGVGIGGFVIWLISNKLPIKNQPYKPLNQKSSNIINLPIDENNDLKLNITWDKKDTNTEKFQLVNPIRKISIDFKTDQDNTIIYKVKGISSKTKSYSENNSSQILFIGTLIIYMLTRLIGITQYPIYFFTDEAIQTNLAADFLRDGYKNYEGELFPTYFKNIDKYSLNTTVYIQIIPYLLFGKSVFVTRATSALLTIFAAYWVGKYLKDIVNIKEYWVGPLILGLIPAWFLHSRTAFEAALMGTFYAGFIYYYGRYRKENPSYIYHALILGGLAFYSYNPGRMIILTSGFILFLLDFKYHIKIFRSIKKSIFLILLLALPFLRFQIDHPTATTDHLRTLNAYWIQPISTYQKLKIFVLEYIEGFSPNYWFFQNGDTLSRHIMGTRPHISLFLLPFFILGIILTLKNISKPEYKLIIVALLAAPSGAALVNIGITRILSFVMPATIIISIGLIKLLTWIKNKVHRTEITVVSLFLLLISINVGLLGDALINGALWDENYGLGGAQYGAKQLFNEIEEYLYIHPNLEIVVSPIWTNGADTVGRFFFDDPLPFQFGSITGYLNNYHPNIENILFIITPEEYDLLIDNPKISKIDLTKTILYPNQKPGFYFLYIQYSDNIIDILTSESEARKVLVETEINVLDQIALVKHSQLDMGTAENLFDNNIYTVSRTSQSNPFIVEIYFPEKINLSGIEAFIGSAQVEIHISIFDDESSAPIHVTSEYFGSVESPNIYIPFNQSFSTDHIKISILDKNQSEPANVHIWELIFDSN